MRCYEVLWGVMSYEQPAITAITPVMAALITLSGVKALAAGVCPLTMADKCHHDGMTTRARPLPAPVSRHDS